MKKKKKQYLNESVNYQFSYQFLSNLGKKKEHDTKCTKRNRKKKRNEIKRNKYKNIRAIISRI